MAMYRRILAVVGAVLLIAGVGGFFLLKASAVGPTTALDRAQVTGYATSTALGRTSGAISVSLDGDSAARIDALVEGLPMANPRYSCAARQQEYRITFSAYSGRRRGAGVRTGFTLTGYWCNNLVVVVPWHGSAVDRIDRDCALMKAVRRLLPSSAAATHAGTCAHASGRLFLAVARHQAAVRAAPVHKTPVHKTSARKPSTRERTKLKAAKRKPFTRVTSAPAAPAPTTARRTDSAARRGAPRHGTRARAMSRRPGRLRLSGDQPHRAIH